MTDRSVVLKAGPMTTLRPRLPNRPTATNTVGSNHWSTEPMMLTGPVTSGRTVFGMPLIVLLLVTMLTGLPLCDWTITATCQSRVNQWVPEGNSYIALRTNRWRASKSDRPYSPGILLASWIAKPDELSELVSCDFDQVYEASNCSPRNSRCVADIQTA